MHFLFCFWYVLSHQGLLFYFDFHSGGLGFVVFFIFVSKSKKNMDLDGEDLEKLREYEYDQNVAYEISLN